MSSASASMAALPEGLMDSGSMAMPQRSVEHSRPVSATLPALVTATLNPMRLPGSTEDSEASCSTVSFGALATSTSWTASSFKASPPEDPETRTPIVSGPGASSAASWNAYSSTRRSPALRRFTVPSTEAFFGSTVNLRPVRSFERPFSRITVPFTVSPGWICAGSSTWTVASPSTTVTFTSVSALTSSRPPSGCAEAFARFCKSPILTFAGMAYSKKTAFCSPGARSWTVADSFVSSSVIVTCVSGTLPALTTVA